MKFHSFEACKSFSFQVHPSDQIINNDASTMLTTLTYGSIVDVLITPEVLYPDKSLRNLKPENRRCLFEDEGILKYFKNYTKKNCEIECVSDLTYENCGCVPFNFVRNKTMNVCDISSWKCALHYKELSRNKKTSCNCLESCKSINYHLEILQNRMKENSTNKFVFRICYEIMQQP